MFLRVRSDSIETYLIHFVQHFITLVRKRTNLKISFFRILGTFQPFPEILFDTIPRTSKVSPCVRIPKIKTTSGNSIKQSES
uniref:Uncharacterized protein n=1 Tax=Leptospira ellisii TaxID=2023197 RepID=A0A2N0BA60_9LEPT|nr:hypothetical protein CH379_08120 [Leptospira ellisii]